MKATRTENSDLSSKLELTFNYTHSGSPAFVCSKESTMCLPSAKARAQKVYERESRNALIRLSLLRIDSDGIRLNHCADMRAICLSGEKRENSVASYSLLREFRE